MQLTTAELCTLAQGAVHTAVCGRFVTWHRFTEKQLAYYRKTSDFFYTRALASAGIRIECRTDATALSFDFRVKQASARDRYSFDLFVDGVMTDHYAMEGVSAEEGHVFFPLPEGTHRVTLYLPSLFGTELAHFTLTDATMIAPVTKSRRMLLLGDSITQGIDCRYTSQTYANLIADMLDASAVNQGVAGAPFDPAAIDSEIGFSPDIVTVAYGTNDYTKSPDRETMIKNANAFYRRVREAFPDAALFGLLPIWRADANAKPRPVGSFEEAKEIVRAAAEAVGATVLDGDGFVPHLPACFGDGHLHPNDFGFKFYADALFGAMRPYLI
ncbi:MAG: SGNH/GDSL hydrolase family protein [Clostridia bacterium]|nr:SGNH/GDSL hydrolase family protein [Clostridia bacterium]